MTQNQSPSESLQKYIDSTLYITTLNNRQFEGRLVSIDFRCNMILHEAIAYIIPEHSCPLNETLDNSLDVKLKEKIEECEKQSGKPWTEEEKADYLKSHYYFGSIMISGNDIKSIKMLKNSKKQKADNEEEK